MLHQAMSAPKDQPENGDAKRRKKRHADSSSDDSQDADEIESLFRKAASSSDLTNHLKRIARRKQGRLLESGLP